MKRSWIRYWLRFECNRRHVRMQPLNLGGQTPRSRIDTPLMNQTHEIPMTQAAEQIDQLQDAVDDLQMRVVFQEDTLQSLNDVISTQDQQIAALQEQVRFLAEKYKSVSYSIERSQSAPSDDRPPHY